MIVSSKPDYSRSIELDHISPFSSDDVLLSIADKKLSNADSYTALTYFNYSIVLNSNIEKSLACESPRMQPAVQRLCELSSLVGKSSEVDVSEGEQHTMSALSKALLSRRAADLILTHHASCSSSSSTNSSSTIPEWKVVVATLTRLSLHWLTACGPSNASTSALVALEALEANAIRKHLNVDEQVVDDLLTNEECVERLADTCGAASPSSTCSPSRNGSMTTLISLVPLSGFKELIEGVTQGVVPPLLTREKYDKCLLALSGTLELPMMMRRLVNVMRIDPMLADGSFVDTLFSSIPSHPMDDDFALLTKDEITRFDIKCYLLCLVQWARLSLTSPLSSLVGTSRILYAAPLPSTIFSNQQHALWKSLILIVQKRCKLIEHAVNIQGIKRVTRLHTSPAVPLMGTVFYVISESTVLSHIADIYARKIIETICCCDTTPDRVVFRRPIGGFDFDPQDETQLFNDCSIFVARREMDEGEYIKAEQTLLMCTSELAVSKALYELYKVWLAKGAANEVKDVEKKMRQIKDRIQKSSPNSGSDKENGYVPSSAEGIINGSTPSHGNSSRFRSPPITINNEDELNQSPCSEYASAPSTPFKVFGIPATESPTGFYTPTRASLWPGAAKSLFQQAIHNASSTSMEVSDTPQRVRVEMREEEVQTDNDESVLNVSDHPDISTQMVEENEAEMQEEIELESMMKGLDLVNESLSALNQQWMRTTQQEKEAKELEDKRRHEAQVRERMEVDDANKAAAVASVVPPLRMNTSILNESESNILINPRSIPPPSVYPNMMYPPPAAPLPSQQVFDPSVMANEQHRMIMEMRMRQQQQQQNALMINNGQNNGQLLQRLLAGGSATIPTPSIPRFSTTPALSNAQSALASALSASSSSTASSSVTPTVTPALSTSSFAQAFAKQNAASTASSQEVPPHVGCICCADDAFLSRWFTAYDRLIDRNDDIE